MKTLFLLLSLWTAGSSMAGPLKKPLEKPKLVVVLVVDQMRADYLTRFSSRFLPAQGSNKVKKLGGFKYLMSQGAYFPLAEYDVMQSMTCPGHAMILTGAHPIMNGIILNEWYDKLERKAVYCADDEKDGISPRHLKTTTVGDELKNAGYKSRVVGISLKDRSGVMLSGHRADQVLWFDSKENQWITSSYYSPDKSVPSWVRPVNESLKKQIGTEYIWESKEKPTGLSESNEVPFSRKMKIGDRRTTASPYGVDVTMNLAADAVKALKLGKGSDPDILAISLSSHDMMGHAFGANSREMEEMTVSEDKAVAQFINFLQAQGVLKNTLFVFTADHGIAPTVEYAQKARIDAGKIEYLTLFKKLNSYLDSKYGRPKNNQWIAGFMSFNFYFDRATLEEKKLDLAEVETEAKKILLSEPGVWYIVTSSEYRKNIIPPGEIGAQLMRQYNVEISGDLILIPRPFYMEGSENTTTHMTGYTYDRMVPLILAGKGIQPGIYPKRAQILDIAPTLSFILGIIPPATSSGQILDIF
jgi:predicted AlkP superfamily pyrophosphatase or phosphodiesterase